MKQRRGSWVGWAAVVVSLVILAAIGPPFLRAYRCYSAWAGGSVSEGKVIQTDASVGLVLQFGDVSSDACTVHLGASSLADFEMGESVSVYRRADRPGECELADTIEASEAFLIAIAACVVVLILVVALIAIGVRRTITRVPELTTRIDVPPDPFICPRCAKPMAEGYLPLQAGVSWRNPDEPVGMVSAFHGLPGTVVSLRRQPRVHAFRCEPCELVIFRYGD